MNWRKTAPFPSARAWIELDRKALRHNVEVLRTRLPKGCELMPAVKANAYGHGMVLLSQELNALGINAFCVATALEGMELRQNGIKGEILILGYTHPEQFHLLRCFRLTQTVVDYAYAKVLHAYGKTIRVHIGIDTGMHRLGVWHEELEHICAIFHMKHLRIGGIFTHLCAADVHTPQGKALTAKQGRAFYDLMEELERRGLSCPKTHSLNSYGLLHYPELGGDYARVGIALYGLLSTHVDTEQCTLALHPVLSLKARVATVKTLYPGDFAGYGLAFLAKQKMKLAILAIGYADGLPRALSNGAGHVLMHGSRAPIVGNICMDQTLVDVTHIPDAKTGDTAVLIGRCGGNRIHASEMAEWSNTITNEVLSRLGTRLERIIR